jgi:hypothetical protein
MGAWGVGPFANDDAQDFLGDLIETTGAVDGALFAALALPADGYVEVPEGSVAVAAAALVAIGAGQPSPTDSQTVTDLLATHQMPATEDLRRAARVALARVVATDSEWAELWQEAGTFDEASAVLDEINAAL